MLIKTIPVGHLETNCYIVTDENTLGCAVIDPATRATPSWTTLRTTASAARPFC